MNFVQQHGLLSARADRPAKPEDLADWERVADRLDRQLELYRLVQYFVQPQRHRTRRVPKALDEWELDAAVDLRAGPGPEMSPQHRAQMIQVLRVLGSALEDAVPDEVLVEQCRQVVADEINHHLELHQVRVRVLPITRIETGQGRPPIPFAYDVQTDSLLGLAYYQFSKIVHLHYAVGRCLGCDRFFHVRDERMQFCSLRCSSNASSRRYNMKKKGGSEPGIAD